MQNLLILGAGQYGMVAKEIAESMRKYDHIDFLDDNNPIAVGKLGDFENLSNVYDSAVVAIGNSDFRLKLIEELRKVGYNIPCLIHERAYVSPSAKIGMGSFIEPMAVVHTEVVVETGCIISAGVIINHNSTIHKGCHINCGCVVKARAEIDEKTRTGYNEVCDTEVNEVKQPLPVAV
ncbi:PglB [Ruminococcus sp.]|uniref:PglD-related sugar-binding protein n=1 Tax=Ruminococcus sp. TaxID=41978 RepID=UPI0025F6A68E|nr:PglB [Ruminococcus sp.]